jgi:DNA-binding MarR family transcriptional regulator
MTAARETPPDQPEETSEERVWRLVGELLPQWWLVDELCRLWLTPHQVALLRAARRPSTITELARRVGLSQPGASRSVRALERRGWLERTRGRRRDHRAVEVVLTPAGAALLDDLHRTGLQRLREQLGRMDPGRRDRVLAWESDCAPPSDC